MQPSKESVSKMERRVLFVVVMAVSCWCMCSAAPSAPAPQQDCSSEITKLVPCLGFVQGTDMNPSKNCCQSLASMVQNNPVCLCQLISSGAGASYGINATLALQLPSKCNLQNVNPTQCSALLPGAPAPAPAPTGHHHHHKGAPSAPPSLEPSGPLPAPTAGGSIPGSSSPSGTFVYGAPLSSPTPAHNSAATFSPTLWMYYMALAALCTFL